MKMDSFDEHSVSTVPRVGEVNRERKRMEVTLMRQTLLRQEIRRGEHGAIRRIALRAVEVPAFDNIMMVIILANCVSLASTSSSRASSDLFQTIVERMFLGAFIFEFVVRATALGRMYFEIYWNWIDVIVMLEGFMSTSLSQGSQAAGLKTLRVLRPLSAGKRVPALRNVVNTLLTSLPSILDSFIVFFFFVAIISILGVVLWAGAFDYECFSSSTGNWVDSESQLCLPAAVDSSSCRGYLFLNQPYQCHSPEQSCLNFGASPGGGYLNFDSFPLAALTVFTMSTREQWSIVMGFGQDVMGEWTFIVFIPVLCLLAYVIVNVVAACILVRLGIVGRADIEASEVQRAVDVAIQERSRSSGRAFDVDLVPLSEKRSSRSMFSLRCESGAHSFAYAWKRFCYRGIPSHHDPTHWSSRIRWAVLDEGSPLTYFIQGCIIVNLFVLALDSYGIDAKLSSDLEVANFALTIIFSCEMGVKLLTCGPAEYFGSQWNVLDAVLVVGSVLEIALTSESSALSSVRLMRLLRLLRIARLARLARRWRALRDVMLLIRTSMKGVWPVLLVLFLFLFTATILSMQLFSTSSDPYIQFTSFVPAFLNCFCVLVAENWVAIMYSVMSESGPAATCFFVPVILIGYFVLLNLVLAIVLGDTTPPTKDIHVVVGLRQIASVAKFNRIRSYWLKWNFFVNEARLVEGHSQATDAWVHLYQKLGERRVLAFAQELHVDGKFLEEAISLITNRSTVYYYAYDRSSWKRLVEVAKLLSDYDARGSNIEEAMLSAVNMTAKPLMKPSRSTPIPKTPIFYLSSTQSSPRIAPVFETHVEVAGFWVRRWRQFRNASKVLRTAPHFRRIYVAALTLSLVASLASDESSRQYSSPWSVVDQFCCAVFSIAAIIDLAVFEIFVTDEHRGLITLIIALGSAFLPLAAQNQSTGGVTVCLIMRSLRPLSIIDKVPDLRSVTTYLFASISKLNTLIVFMLFSLTAYAVMGMQLMGGLFYSCIESSEDVARIGAFPPNSPRDGVMALDGRFVSRPCRGTFLNATGSLQTARGLWANPTFHFDNFPNAFLSVIILTTNGWSTIAYQALSATRIGFSPSPYAGAGDPLITCYFIFGVFFFGNFMMNLFIGVVFEIYNEIRAISADGKLSKGDAREWQLYERRLASVKPHVRRPEPAAAWRKSVAALVQSANFQRLTMSVIAANALTLACSHAGQSSDTSLVMSWLNVVFSFCYAVEALLKVAGRGVENYLAGLTDQFDFIVTCVSVLDSCVFLSGPCANLNSAFLRLVRSLRVLRLARLLHAVPRCEKVVQALTYSAPGLVTVMLILLLLDLFFATFGWVFFQNLTHKGARYANFYSYKGSFELLFIIMTGDNWSDYLGQFMQQAGSLKPAFVLYFMLYFMLTSFVISNMFVMVICEAFFIFNGESKTPAEDLIPVFQRHWADLDTKATGFLTNPFGIEVLLRRLPEPFGVAYPSAGSTLPRSVTFMRIRTAAEWIRAQKGFDGSFTHVLSGIVHLWLTERGDLNIRGAKGKMNMLAASVLITLRARRFLYQRRNRADRTIPGQARGSLREGGLRKSFDIEPVACEKGSRTDSKSLPLYRLPDLSLPPHFLNRRHTRVHPTPTIMYTDILIPIPPKAPDEKPTFEATIP